MRPRTGRLVRPTLRCLFEDLVGEVGPSELAEAALTARQKMVDDPHYVFPVPLTDAEHLLLDKANMLAATAGAERERIQVITDRRVFKVKAADRRGALWQDHDGVWWLLAAGRRKDSGPGDFYRMLDNHRDDSSRIAPTDADRRYLRLESAYIAEWETERKAQRAVLDAVLHAAANQGVGCPAEVFGAIVVVKIEPEDDGSGRLSLSIDFKDFDQKDRIPVDVLAAIPGFQSIEDWDVLPPLRPTDSQYWYTYVERAWIEWLAAAVELETLVVRQQTQLTKTDAVSAPLSHYAPADAVTAGYEGVEIAALCGARFIPSRNPRQYEHCVPCVRVLALLRGGATG